MASKASRGVVVEITKQGPLAVDLTLVTTFYTYLQPTRISLGRLVLRPDEPLVIGLRRIDQGNEWGFVKRIFDNPQNMPRRA